MFKKLVKSVKKMVKKAKAKLLSKGKARKNVWAEYYSPDRKYPLVFQLLGAHYEIHIIPKVTQTREQVSVYDHPMGLEDLFSLENHNDLFARDLGLQGLFELEDERVYLDVLFESEQNITEDLFHQKVDEQKRKRQRPSPVEVFFSNDQFFEEMVILLGQDPPTR